MTEVIRMKIYSILLLAAAFAYCVRSEQYLIETQDAAADGDLEDINRIADDLGDGMKGPVIGNNQKKND